MIIVLYGPPRPTNPKNVRKKLFLAKHIVSALLTQKLQKSGTHFPAPVHQIVHECHGSGVCLPTVTQGNMTYSTQLHLWKLQEFEFNLIWKGAKRPFQKLVTPPSESPQPQKLCTANFSSGTLKTLINRPLRLKKTKYFDDILLRKSTFPHYRRLEHHFPLAKSGFWGQISH